MENEEYKFDVNLINNEDDSKYFKLDYKNQNIENSMYFKKWKDSKLKEYGNNAKVFKCSLDNCLFISSYDDCMSYPIYQAICPICKNPICYYCSRYIVYQSFHTSCCVKMRLKFMVGQHSFRYIDPRAKENEIIDCKEAFFYFIIPGLNLLMFMAFIFRGFFFAMPIKKGEYKLNVAIPTYENYLGRNNQFISTIILCLEILNVFLLIIPFLIIYTYFVIFLLLISLLFKLYPLKFYLGMFYADSKSY